jgi:hypothetical protein
LEAPLDRNPVLSGIGRLFFASRVTDFHCGMRALALGTLNEEVVE